MAYINKDVRVSMILQVMDELENSPLSINQYFKEKDMPFGRAQYYLYKKARRERGHFRKLKLNADIACSF